MPEYLVPWSWHKPAMVNNVAKTESMRYLINCSMRCHFEDAVFEFNRNLANRGLCRVEFQDFDLLKKQNFMNRMRNRIVGDKDEDLNIPTMAIVLDYNELNVKLRVAKLLLSSISAVLSKLNLDCKVLVCWRSFHKNSFLADYKLNAPMSVFV